jgi:hypothetical protein
MRNCQYLVEEIMKRVKNCHQHDGPQKFTFHSHVVIQEVDNNIDSFEDFIVVDVFDALSYLDLKKSDII